VEYLNVEISCSNVHKSRTFGLVARRLPAMDQLPVVYDPLGEALHGLRMSGAFYCRCEFTAPWGLALPEMPDTLMFHVVTSGRCWLEVEGAEGRLLHPGDLALVPHGEGHRMSSEPGTPGHGLFDLPRAYQSDRYEVIRQGGGGSPSTIVCAAIAFDHPAARNLVEALPRLICVEAADSPQADWIASTVRLITAEARHLRPGGEGVITRLADVLVIQAIRHWIDSDPAARTGWLDAMRDPQIGRAIALMHHDPAQPWTIAALAGEVAMSRSAFAARFTALVGEPPLQYLTRWRMQVAMTLLEDPASSIGDVALQLGYRSEAAFSRAYKRFTGMSPGAVRRRRLPASAAETPSTRYGAPARITPTPE
jgi:AraC-like DNA-binding protein